jgi:uncharacterized protein (DUF433 family)
MAERRPIPLSDGIYTVSEACLILGPKVTPRRVHYWLNTGLISGEPVIRGAKGTPTLLTFRQLLEIRTVQHLRDELRVTLPRVREAYGWILRHVFDQGAAVTFERGAGGDIIARTPDGESTVIPYGQGAFPKGPDTDELTHDLSVARQAWLDKKLRIREHVVADTRVLAGSPTVDGTRIETALVASFAAEGQYDDDVIASVEQTYPHLPTEAIVDALEFEGIRRAA